MYPTYMTFYGEAVRDAGEDYSTTYITCAGSEVEVTPEGGRFPHFTMKEGSVAAVVGRFHLGPLDDQLGGSVKVFAITRIGYQGMLALSQVEEQGRLAYIDGCSDTLIIPPPRCGDPCLNHLYFPTRIKQTQHLHPSIRMGIVLKGEGTAWQDTDLTGKGWEKPLIPGSMFCLEESEIHSFKTDESDLHIIAYHPDTDTGPTDTDQPMLNRTYINHGK